MIYFAVGAAGAEWSRCVPEFKDVYGKSIVRRLVTARDAKYRAS